MRAREGLLYGGLPYRAATGPALAAGTPGGWLATALMWLVGTRMNAGDPSDLLITIAAEDAFDAAPDLPRISGSSSTGDCCLEHW